MVARHGEVFRAVYHPWYGRALARVGMWLLVEATRLMLWGTRTMRVSSEGGPWKRIARARAEGVVLEAYRGMIKGLDECEGPREEGK